MRIEDLLFAVALALAALGIVCLNDKMKKKGSKSQRKSKASESKWGLLVSIAVTIGIIALTFMYGREAPNLTWIIPLVLIAVGLLVLLLVSRKVIWLFLKCVLTGRPLPHLIKKSENGNLQMKCPHCSTPVHVTPGHKGEVAFQCENCGEEATWDTELK